MTGALLPLPGQATPASIVDIDTGPIDVDVSSKAQLLEDPGTRMSLADVRSAAAPWRANTLRSLNFGMTHSAWWIRVSIRNTRSQDRSLVLDLGTPLQDFVDWYVIGSDGGLELENHSGDRLPYGSRLIDETTLALPLSLAANEGKQIYIRVDTHDGLFEIMVPRLYDQASFSRHADRIDMVLVMYFGAMIALMLLNSLLWIRTREPAFGFYVGYLFAILVAFSGIFGFDLKYLWPDRPILHNNLELASESVIFVMASLFTFAYIDVSRHISQRTLKLYRAALWLVSLGVIPALLDRYAIGFFFVVGDIVVVAWFYGHYVLLARRGVREAELIVAAFTIFILGLVTYGLTISGVIPAFGWTSFVLPTGSTIEMVLLSFGLADSVSRLKAQRRMAESAVRAASLRSQRESEANAARERHRLGHDAATGLPNQGSAEQRIAKAIRDQRGFAVILIMLADLPQLGTARVHELREAALHRLAGLIQARVGHAGYTARLAGDVFLVLLLESDVGRSVALADQLTADAGTAVNLLNVEVELTPYFGIALYPAHGLSEADLISRARIAIEEARALPGRLQIYQHGSDLLHNRIATLVRDLRHAPALNQLRLHFQPVISLASNQCRGVEALVRWQHPELGLLMPSEFIPMAEKSRAIHALTLWAIDEALRHLGNWREDHPTLRIAVNISIQDLHHRDLPAYIAARLQAYRVPPEFLTLELTETAVMLDPPVEIAMLNELSDLGLTLAVDDFGTGYSSLLYLKKLPVTIVKIDRSFVESLKAGSSDEVIVRSIIEMAHTLGLSVVAEGVESADTVELLRAWHCDAVQGFLISEARPDADFRHWLQAWNHNHPPEALALDSGDA